MKARIGRLDNKLSLQVNTSPAKDPLAHLFARHCTAFNAEILDPELSKSVRPSVYYLPTVRELPNSEWCCGETGAC